MGTPKYIQIENTLRSEIESGRFESGDLFYSNAELIERFGVSSITVIHAVNDLVNEGLLVRYQGKGTFVSRSRRHRPVRISESERFFEGGGAAETRVIGLSFPEGDERDPGVVERLGLSGRGRYAVIERVRLYNGCPISTRCPTSRDATSSRMSVPRITSRCTGVFGRISVCFCRARRRMR